MSTSIRISEETKKKLEAVKRTDETFDELLSRLVVDRSKADIDEWVGGGGKGLADHMQAEREELNESLQKREDGTE